MKCIITYLDEKGLLDLKLNNSNSEIKLFLACAYFSSLFSSYPLFSQINKEDEIGGQYSHEICQFQWDKFHDVLYSHFSVPCKQRFLSRMAFDV